MGGDSHPADCDGEDVDDGPADLFREIDRDGTGTLSAAEIYKNWYLHGEAYTAEDAHELLAELDVDGDGQLSVKEYFGHEFYDNY